MNENEAIQALIGEFESEQGANEAQEAQENTGAQGAEQEAQKVEANGTIPNNQDELVSQIKQVMQSQSAPKAGEAQSKESVEQNELLAKLGLGDLGAIKEQLNTLKEAYQAQQEEARQRAVFDKNAAEFEKEFPTIKLDEMGKWAEKNGFLQLLGENYDSWRLVAKAMINVGQARNEPDAITSSDNNGAKASVSQRLKNGEEVSDIEIGADLLRASGII